MAVTHLNPSDVLNIVSQREGDILVFAKGDVFQDLRVVILGPRPVTLHRTPGSWDPNCGWACVSGTVWPQSGGWSLAYQGTLSGGGRIPRRLEKLLRLRRQADRERLRRKVLEEFVTSFFKD